MPQTYVIGETDERPWGNWEVLSTGDGHVVKRIRVTPGKRLSLQRHRHRSEHWIVVAGQGVATVGEAEIPVTADSQIWIPVGAIHRIANTGTEPLVFVEVQTGALLIESDIERLQDDAGRV